MFVDAPSVIQAAAVLAAARYTGTIARNTSVADRLGPLDSPVVMLIATLKEMAAQGVIPDEFASFEPPKPK